MTLNIPEVEAFTVSLTGEDDRATTFQVAPDVTTLVLNEDVSAYLDVGRDYIISVCSVNSVGCSETVSVPLGMCIQQGGEELSGSNNRGSSVYYFVLCNISILFSYHTL